MKISRTDCLWCAACGIFINPRTDECHLQATANCTMIHGSCALCTVLRLVISRIRLSSVQGWCESFQLVDMPQGPFWRVKAGADAGEERREEAGSALQLLPAQKLQALDQRCCHVRLLLHRQPLNALL